MLQGLEGQRPKRSCNPCATGVVLNILPMTGQLVDPQAEIIAAISGLFNLRLKIFEDKISNTAAPLEYRSHTYLNITTLSSQPHRSRITLRHQAHLLNIGAAFS